MSDNKSETIKATTIPALEHIKALELEIARRIVLVQDEMAKAEVNAQQEATKISKTIETEGRSQAEAQYQKIVAAARNQAQIIIEEAYQTSQHLNQRQTTLLDQAAQYAFKLILGSAVEESDI